MQIIRALTISISLLLGAAPFASVQDYNKGLDAYKAYDYATALQEWKPLAEQDQAPAQGNLGVMYEFGNGVFQDYVIAHMW
tara:strand:+ start:726 stop:968 length:243 start_codon:yes stop_codon:yes gene_type:complete